MLIGLKNLWPTISSLAAAAVLFFAIAGGIKSGQALAQAQVIGKNAESLNAGLSYFYNDQNSYPTAVQFADQAVMLNYFSKFPPVNLPSSECGQSFIYKRTAPLGFQLSFCLPQAYGKFTVGWNTINGNAAAAD